MDHQPIPLGPWPLGVNFYDPAGSLDARELSQCINYRLDQRGYPSKRPGFTTFGSAPAQINGLNFVNFIARFYKPSAKTLLAAAAGKLFTLNENTGAATQVTIDGGSGAVMHATNLYHHFTYKDRLYILDGTKPVRYSTGSDAPFAGFFNHAAPAGVATAGGALSAGTYKYAVANVAGEMGEGPIGSQLSIAVNANDKVDLSSIADAPARWEQTAKRIYRTKANGTQFFFLAEIANTVTTYQDLTADSALTQLYVPVHNPRSDARFALLGTDERIYWFGMAGVSSSIVEVSDIGFPDRLLDNEFFTIANRDGDVLTGGAQTASGLLFFKRNSTWLHRGFGTEPINISPKIGCVSPKSIVEVPGGVVFLSTRGEVYFFDGAQLSEIGRSIKPEFIEMPSAAMGRIAAVYHDFRYIISYDYRGNRGYNWRHMEYELVSGKWDGPHENGERLTSSCFCAFDSESDRNELMWGEARSVNGSFVYIRRDPQYVDLTTKISSTLRTGHLRSAGRGEFILSKARIHGRFTSDTQLNVGIVLDDEVTIIDDLILDGTGSQPPQFGIAKFGLDRFGFIFATGGETPLETDARALFPQLRITDSGTSTYHLIEEVILLGKSLTAR